MTRGRLRKALQAVVLVAFLAGDLAILVPPAAAQGPLVNAGLGLFRVLNAINRRNRVYQAARDTQQDFNTYYAALQDTARRQLTSGELSSLRRGEQGMERVRIAAYVRMNQALQAEQAAIRRAINAETNQARRNFNRTLVRQLQEVITRLPGAQQILHDVRAAVSNVRNTIIALQTAAAANQPLDVLTQRLAEQVSSSQAVQDRVRELGSMLGPDLDRSLGGALTQVNNSIQDINREANQAVQLLDGMDAQVAALDLSESESPQAGEPIGPLGIRLTDRAASALDVASQAMAFLTAMQGGGGRTRDEMYQQIRNELLNERNTHLLQAAQNVGQVECREVGWSEYEAARGALNEPPQTEGVAENPKYYVCYDRDTAEPIGAWIGRVTLPTETPDRTPRASATGTSSRERWTLQQADAAQYMSFTAELIEDFTEQFRSSCHYDIHVTNTHPTYNLQMECETYYSTTTTGYSNTNLPRFGLTAGHTVNFGHSVRQTFRDDVSQDYVVRCVGYLGNASTGAKNWGTEWLHDDFKPEGSLLESGLTVVVPPNPCAR